MNDEIIVIEATTSEEDIVAVEKEESPTVVVEAIEIPTVVLVGNALNINVSNEITTTTTTDLTGILKGNGTTIAVATAGIDYVAPNVTITGATKTKITYDAKGLVTNGADATTADIADSTDKRYCTDAQKIVIGNTSGINTGDQTNISGNAGTATILATARAINGVDFNGSAAITVPVNNANDVSTDVDVYLLWTATQGGNYAAKTSIGLKYHPSTGLLTAAGFSGPLTGNVTGTASGNLVAGGALGTPSSGTLTNCTFPTLNQNTTGTAAGLSTTLVIGSGGTGSTTGSITGSTALTFVAGGSNQNVTLTPSGNGINILNSAADYASLRLANSTNYFEFTRSSTTGALQIQGNQTGYNSIALCPTSGTVYIGKVAANSGYKLYVYDSSNFLGFCVENAGNSTTAQIQNSLKNDAGSLAYYGITASGYTNAPILANRAFFGSYNVDTVIWTQSAHDIIFATGGTSLAAEKMRLVNSGNLLINTTTDDTVNKLQVNGSVKTTAINSAGALSITAGGSNQNITLSASGTGAVEHKTNSATTVISATFENVGVGQNRVHFYRNGDAGTGFTKGMVLFAASSNCGWADYESRFLSFYTGASAGSATEQMRISNTGVVSIFNNHCTAKRFFTAVTALTTGATVSLDVSLGDFFTLTPDQDLTINITGTSYVGYGQVIKLKILTSGTTSRTITFGTNFISTGTLATGTSNAKTFVLTFACFDGTNFVEVSRTTAL